MDEYIWDKRLEYLDENAFLGVEMRDLLRISQTGSAFGTCYRYHWHILYYSRRNSSWSKLFVLVPLYHVVGSVFSNFMEPISSVWFWLNSKQHQAETFTSLSLLITFK